MNQFEDKVRGYVSNRFPLTTEEVSFGSAQMKDSGDTDQGFGFKGKVRTHSFGAMEKVYAYTAKGELKLPGGDYPGDDDDIPGSEPETPPVPPVYQDKCKGASIGYTTQGMQTGESQTLEIINQGGGEYTWEITGGTGTLAGSTYTAPLDNPECQNNATIVLKCGGDIIDTVGIAINAAGAQGAFSKCQSYAESEYHPPCWYGGPPGTRTVCYWYYDCNGDSMPNEPYNEECCVGVYGHDSPVMWGSHNLGCNGMSNMTEGTFDYRTALQIKLGCCPAEFL